MQWRALADGKQTAPFGRRLFARRASAPTRRGVSERAASGAPQCRTRDTGAPRGAKTPADGEGGSLPAEARLGLSRQVRHERRETAAGTTRIPPTRNPAARPPGLLLPVGRPPAASVLTQAPEPASLWDGAGPL